MEKFTAVVFDTEDAVYKGEKALRDLHGRGELGVYGGGILRGAETPRLDALAAEGAFP